MALLKEFSNKGATVAWSNVAAHSSLLALGTKDSGNAGFEDYGGELEVHKLDFTSNDAPSLLGKVKTTARFATLAWSEMATKQQDYPYGLIAGGMSDGSVNVWDPAKLVSVHKMPQVASVQRHTGPVTGLMFNPHHSSSHLLASGGADANVYIIALDRPDQPNVFVPAPPPNQSKHTGEITKCAWNTQVSHIMATSSADGSCIVWDLRQKKPWCELRDPSRAPIADIAWKPDQGLHLVTASGDDKNPLLKLWDLRMSTSLPLATLAGHTQGILSVAWCPTDSSLLMSCAKDNRTLLWDLYTKNLQAVYELPSGAIGGGSGGDASAAFADTQTTMFGGLAGSASSRRYQVAWSPRIPAVIATCSFDRKVQVFSMTAARSSNGRAPKWLQRRCGASFGFGGKLVTFGTKAGGGDGADGGDTPAMGAAPIRRIVRLLAVREDPALVAASRSFEEAMATRDFKSFCEARAASASNAHERSVWQFMQVIFEKNAREQLLSHLGFNADIISAEASECLAKLSSSGATDHSPKAIGSPNGAVKGDAASIFGSQNGSEAEATAQVTAVLEAVDLQTPPPPAALKRVPPAAAGAPIGGTRMSKEAETLVKKALLVGNFEAAVQCCLKAGNMADALLLASCGGADLWAQTQAAYFDLAIAEKPFLRIVSAIIKSELGALVENSDLRAWRETLAILSTYAKSEEFPALCETLAARLEGEARDRASANLCFMCAVNVPKTIAMWAEELAAANRAGGAQRQQSSAQRGVDAAALHRFVEKVSVFSQAEPDTPLGPEATSLFAAYAAILAAEGETRAAATYITGQDAASMVLKDRLYNGCLGDPAVAGMAPPPFPFARVHVGVSPAAAAPTATSAPAAATMAHFGGAQQGQQQAAQAAAHTPMAGAYGAGGFGAVAAAPAAAAAAAGAAALPPGWTQLMDPQRGIPYYCNNTTGQTQWERPAPAPVPVAAPMAAVAAPQQPMAGGYQSAATLSPYGVMPSPHSRAGGGFPAAAGGFQSASGGGSGGMPHMAHAPPQQQQAVSAMSVPRPGGISAPMSAGGTAAPSLATPTAMGQQQQQQQRWQPQQPQPVAAPVATPAPMPVTAPGIQPPQAPGTGFGRPAAAAPAPAPVPEPAPTPPAPQVPTDPAQLAAAAAAQGEAAAALVSALQQIVGALSGAAMAPAEGKMLAEGVKAVHVLFGRIVLGTADAEVVGRVATLCGMLMARDGAGAAAVYKDLVNDSWNAHKDWLKGFKHITTLARKL